VTTNAHKASKGWFVLTNKPFLKWQCWALPLLLSTITCGPLDVITVDETSTTTINKASIFEQLLGDIGFGAFLNINLVDNTQMRNQNVEAHQIDSVYATALSLTITEPTSGQDFSFIDSISFFVSTGGEEKVRIAWLDTIAPGTTRLELEIDDIDLSPYATADSMTITSFVDGRRPDYDTVVEAQITLDVDLNVGGLLCGAPAEPSD
tara:strand:- start:334 stop:954 length:621 start_codon:yes stop_codon:yes gene_type:complete